MADLLWDDVKYLLDPDSSGLLSQGRIIGTTLQDWRSLVSLARARRWRLEFVEDGRLVATDDPDVDLFVRADNAMLMVDLWPAAEIHAHLWLITPEEITFDLDLREVRTQQHLDQLCDFLRAVGRQLGKSVLIMPEDGDEDLESCLVYDIAIDRVMLIAATDAQRFTR